MANREQRVQISIEIVQDAEEFIRKLIREEIKKCLQEEAQMLRSRAPHLTYETKTDEEGWQR
jgi:hypothetical protein